MKWLTKSKAELLRIGLGILSAPVFVKILGIGTIVAIVFGGVTLFFTRNEMSNRMSKLLERRAFTVARTLSADIKRPMVTGDVPSVKLELESILQEYPDVSYIVVRDFDEKVVAHTFEKDIPSEFVHRLPESSDPSEEKSNPSEDAYLPSENTFDPSENKYVPSENTRVLQSEGVAIFDVVEPIPGDQTGYIQIGLSNEMVQEEMAALTRMVFGALGISVILGVSLAIFLTHLLTYPIYHLIEVAERIRKGSFESRAKVFSADEIGALAETINHMAESLEDYQHEVQEKEKARASLLAKIVQTQEDERKNIALELHDQLGQGLSKTLVSVQGIRKERDGAETRWDELEKEILGHIDDVRQLAWDMRPAVLDDYGLDSALERYLRDIQERTNMEVEYQKIIPSESDRLPIEVEVNIYRIAQEAMTNVIRHAHADRVCVTLLREDAQLSFVIEDNGDGFDVSLYTKPGVSSLGLMGMKERAALIGAEVEIESKPGQGTEVLVTVPITEVDYAD